MILTEHCRRLDLIAGPGFRTALSYTFSTPFEGDQLVLRVYSQGMYCDSLIKEEDMHLSDEKIKERILTPMIAAFQRAKVPQ